MPKLSIPKLSIAARLYATFALLAVTMISLAAITVTNANYHSRLTDDFEAAFAGAQNIERVNGLIYAVNASARGIFMATDQDAVAKYAEEMLKANDQISAVVADWQTTIRRGDAAQFSDFSVRLSEFQQYPRDLAQIATDKGARAAELWAASGDAVAVRDKLSKDVQRLGDHYATQAKRIYASIDAAIDQTAMTASLVGILAIVLAGLGVLQIRSSVAQPLARITSMTEAVASGGVATSIPYRDRQDEIGALARSIAIFQGAMQKNEELKVTVVQDAESRTQRQEKVTSEITRFSADIETTLAELGRISDQMLEASGRLAGAADAASTKTAQATAASNEASANVRDIASAADELSASVNEIDRQVAQSNAIASKAVSEAERTNEAVKELDEAAARIGDVIKLITDIAEQTNLLALNATIEAARAGEAGRGFAVVAGEVKALAGQTGRATEEIAAQIAGMQRATGRSIEAINAIEHTIREIGEISGAIAAAVTEQGAATQEIARSVEIAAKRTHETAGEVGLVGSATEDTRSSASAVKNVAEDLGNVAGRIRSQVDLFFERLSA